MDKQEKLKIMKAIQTQIVDYLQEELSINSNALKAYDNQNPLLDQDQEIKKMREVEAIKLRYATHELNRYIAVIKRMVPTTTDAALLPTSSRKAKK